VSQAPSRIAGALHWVAGARPHPAPIRRREFWITQLLVLGVVVLLYGSHVLAGRLEPRGGWIGTLAEVHDSVSAFAIFPIAYAALTFGVEGAVLTSLWIALLLAPHTLFPPSTNHQWLMDLGIGVASLGASLLLAGRVRVEREARWRAEAMSARLRLLHGLGLSLRRARPLPELLQGFVDTLRDGMDLDYVTLWYRAESGAPPLLVESGDRSLGAALSAHGLPPRDAPAPLLPLPPDADTGVFPLTGEHSSFGVLGVVSAHRPLPHDEREILAIAGLEASISLEVLRIEEMRRESLERYARQVTNAQEEERARIARELHDGVVQTLSGLVRAIDLVTEEARRAGAAGEVERAGLEELREIASDGLSELRRVTRDLRPTTLDRLGLLAAVRSLATELGERAGVAIDFHFGDARPLPRESELCIFRIVQEALSNVEKHSGATRVEVAVGFSDDAVRVEVRDNGKGYAPPEDANELARHGRYGMLGMTERAALVGGTLEVSRLITGGTRVALRMPLRPPADGPAEVADAADERPRVDVDPAVDGRAVHAG
jgi:signal transduction histidine kinase